MQFQNWKDSGSYFSYRNYQIFYKEAGAGLPLILVHGFPKSSWDWNKIWDSLVQKYEMYAMDMVGYCFSSKPTDIRYTIALQVGLWEAFLRQKKDKFISTSLLIIMEIRWFKKCWLDGKKILFTNLR